MYVNVRAVLVPACCKTLSRHAQCITILDASPGPTKRPAAALRHTVDLAVKNAMGRSVCWHWSAEKGRVTLFSSLPVAGTVVMVALDCGKRKGDLVFLFAHCRYSGDGGIGLRKKEG